MVNGWMMNIYYDYISKLAFFWVMDANLTKGKYAYCICTFVDPTTRPEFSIGLIIFYIIKCSFKKKKRIPLS